MNDSYDAHTTYICMHISDKWKKINKKLLCLFLAVTNDEKNCSLPKSV